MGPACEDGAGPIELSAREGPKRLIEVDGLAGGAIGRTEQGEGGFHRVDADIHKGAGRKAAVEDVGAPPGLELFAA